MIFDLNTHYSGLPEHCINIITSAEQDPNAGNSRVAVCRSQKVPKHDFEHFRTSGEHADSTNRLARYGFLLVFYSDLKSMWNQVESAYKSSKAADRNPQQLRRTTSRFTKYPISRSR